MKRILEAAKTVLIIILFVGMLLLTAASLPTDSVRNSLFLSTVLRPLGPALGLPQAELAYVEEAQPVMDAALPLMISVRNTAGRYTAMWDFRELDRIFEEMGGLLGEALDTAENLTEATHAQVLQALSGSGVWFSYENSLPANMVAVWLDADTEQQLPEANGFVLSVEDSGVVLYLLEEDGYSRAETKLSTERLMGLLENYRPDGTKIAFETDSALYPLTLLPAEGSTVPEVQRYNPCTGRYLETLATNFGFNPYGDSVYTDTAGDTYFSETNCSLRVTADGDMTLRSTAQQRFRAQDAGDDALAEEARRLVALAVGEVMEDARLYMTSMERQGTETTVTFDYAVSGIPVKSGEKSGASVTFSGTAVTEMNIRLAAFSVLEQPCSVLPATQAAAIMPEGSALRMRYLDDGSQVSAGWWKGEE